LAENRRSAVGAATAKSCPSAILAAIRFWTGSDAASQAGTHAVCVERTSSAIVPLLMPVPETRTARSLPRANLFVDASEHHGAIVTDLLHGVTLYEDQAFAQV
jgi:hypothetical protein